MLSPEMHATTSYPQFLSLLETRNLQACIRRLQRVTEVTYSGHAVPTARIVWGGDFTLECKDQSTKIESISVGIYEGMFRITGDAIKEGFSAGRMPEGWKAIEKTEIESAMEPAEKLLEDMLQSNNAIDGMFARTIVSDGQKECEPLLRNVVDAGHLPEAEFVGMSRFPKAAAAEIICIYQPIEKTPPGTLIIIEADHKILAYPFRFRFGQNDRYIFVHTKPEEQ